MTGGPTINDKGSLLYGDNDAATLKDIVQSLFTVDFALFAAAYYMFYLVIAAAVSAIAVIKFKVDYTNLKISQLRREIFLTLEGYTTNAVCYWIVLQFISSWRYDFTDVKDVAISYIGNSLVFNAWFYFSHRLWHSNRFLYHYVHSHHHESVIVCPLTALSNAWTESVWVSTGYVIGPYFFGFSNIWGWYMVTLSIVLEAIIGHSRIPYSLEHATHHAAYNKNYGFFSYRMGRINFDKLLNTWSYKSEIPRMCKLYRREVMSYVWNDNEYKVNWDMLGKDVDCDEDIECGIPTMVSELDERGSSDSSIPSCLDCNCLAQNKEVLSCQEPMEEESTPLNNDIPLISLSSGKGKNRRHPAFLRLVSKSLQKIKISKRKSTNSKS